MSLNILNAVRSYLTPDLISGICLSLHENEQAVNNALSGVVPVVLSGFVTKANSGNNNANDILDIVLNVYKEGVNGQIGKADGALFNKGLHLAQVLFDDKFNSLIDTIAFYAGIKRESAISLFSLAASLIAGLLGKYAADLNMSAANLSSFLHSQKINIMSMLPADLSAVTGLLGLSKMGDARRSDRKRQGWRENITTDKSKLKKGWLLWILMFAVILFAVIYFAHKR